MSSDFFSKWFLNPDIKPHIFNLEDYDSEDSDIGY